MVIWAIEVVQRVGVGATAAARTSTLPRALALTVMEKVAQDPLASEASGQVNTCLRAVPPRSAIASLPPSLSPAGARRSRSPLPLPLGAPYCKHSGLQCGYDRDTGNR